MKDKSGFSTKMSATMGALCGYERHEGNGFTKDEVSVLADHYGFDLDGCENALMRAGAMRNMFRRVDQDGLRIMALIGRYLEEGEDPVHLVTAGLAALGFDITTEDDAEEG
ncbi:hypothetical protein LCGC14_1353070 [marine sediment metagenome]|uniref:Uncharacterized protein n=1 Tax=marine sediment metagenome TaxID=412755 RepID=A0A0F9KAX7_9ZZZZ